MQILDSTLYVPKNFPEVEAIRAGGCRYTTPRRDRADFARAFFCNQWGDSFKCICPPKPQDSDICWKSRQDFQARGVGREVQSLNHFSALPLRPEGVYPGVIERPTMSQRQGLIDRDTCPQPEIGWTETCPPGTILKPTLFIGDSVCGPCVKAPPKKQEDIICNDFPGFDISRKNMPFRIYFPESPAEGKIRIRTGVERCLQPSRFRELTTCYREGFTDFMKTKTPKQISLYRSPLVIDHSRPRPHLKVDPNPGIMVDVNSGPLTLNARPMRNQMFGMKRPSCLPEGLPFKISVAGPIVIPVDNLPYLSDIDPSTIC